MMLGSIPQQDVFQRVMSSKNEKVARNASVLGGVIYFFFVFIPIFLAYSATLIDPDMVSRLLDTDSQLVLPTLIMEKMPVFAQVMFFGALLSAIKSCASATLLAPSVTFTENVLKEIRPWKNDREFLFSMRAVVLIFTVGVTTLALNSQSSIYEMVENAYKVTLVAAFVPLAFGVYWQRATRQGALMAMVLAWCPGSRWNTPPRKACGRRNWPACCSPSAAWWSVRSCPRCWPRCRLSWCPPRAASSPDPACLIETVARLAARPFCLLGKSSELLGQALSKQFQRPGFRHYSIFN
jgi:hypothetical protein